MLTIKATATVELKSGKIRHRKFWTFRLPAAQFYEVIMRRCTGPEVQSIVIGDVQTWQRAGDALAGLDTPA